MTQKQKAEAYDKAIAKAQKELQTCGSTDCDAARQIYRFFPELSESEDERIRKSIIAIINNYVDNSNTFKPKMIAWLEKQGIYKVWTNNDYDKIKSIEYLLHELDNHNFDDWFNLLKKWGNSNESKN